MTLKNVIDVGKELNETNFELNPLNNNLNKFTEDLIENIKLLKNNTL